jgi:hypothetical protein
MATRAAALISLAAALTAAGTAVADSTPVGPLPAGPVQQVELRPGATFTATLPEPAGAGRVWRIARAFDGGVVRPVAEGDLAGGGVWVRFRGVAPGTTRVVFAMTRGETAKAEAAHTFAFTVARAGCPANLLPLTANPIGPSVTAALVADDPANRPQVTAAVTGPSDVQRGPQVKAQCGTRVWQRTVVVYITDRALLPSQSAAQRVFFVGRTGAGYRVWQQAR